MFLKLNWFLTLSVKPTGTVDLIIMTTLELIFIISLIRDSTD
jgi:hypothetical protein